MLQRVEYSDVAKVELQEAALIAIDYLCIKENVLPEIMNTICARAMQTGVGMRSTYNDGKYETHCALSTDMFNDWNIKYYHNYTPSHLKLPDN